MHISQEALLLISLSCAGAVCAAQPPSTLTRPPANVDHSTTPAAAPAPVPVPAPPSSLLQPALDSVRRVVRYVDVDRWKKGTVREEADRNIGAIQRDLVETLPPMMKDADGAPGTLSKVLPVSRNVDALYDVLVHVVEASRVSAPGDQVAQLQQALDTLEKARVALGLRLQDQALAQEKQIGTLRTAFQAQSASLQVLQAALGIPACPAPPPVKKPLPRRRTLTTKPTASSKPAAAPSSNQKPSAAGAPASKSQ